MTNKIKPLSFEAFIEFFPEVELPVVLTEESIHSFSALNKPLPISGLIEFLKVEESDIDEYTEYVPCFRFPISDNYISIVYWKGGVLSYEYFLLTIDLKSLTIKARKIISGIKANNNILLKSNAVITADYEIEILVNHYEKPTQIYPSKSVKYHVEIMDDGSMHSEKEIE